MNKDQVKGRVEEAKIKVATGSTLVGKLMETKECPKEYR
jgi:hypothetical protein